jgi:hypothetical protein
MIHKELLVKIDNVKDYCEGAVSQVHGEFCISSDQCKCSEMETAQNGIYKALRAVVELHYEKSFGEDSPIKNVCDTCSKVYPCPTVQAIEKELA